MKLGMAEASCGAERNAIFAAGIYHLGARRSFARASGAAPEAVGGPQLLVAFVPLRQLCLDVILLIRSHFDFRVERLVSRQGDLDVVLAWAEEHRPARASKFVCVSRKLVVHENRRPLRINRKLDLRAHRGVLRPGILSQRNAQCLRHMWFDADRLLYGLVTRLAHGYLVLSR